ncbi:MAG: hypothetical protein M3542_02475, partial [Acidobacteriota bacterium]|nr:hypothetical protein [Acidobacteriota bacterium]
ASLSFKQRFYYVIDDSNTATRTESDLMSIASPTAASATTVPTYGWFLQFVVGERLITDSLAVKGVLFFSTFNPAAAGVSRDTCNNLIECLMQRGAPRFYEMKYATGDAYAGSDRGTLKANATFLTNPVAYTSADQQMHVIFTSDNEVDIIPVPGGTRTTLKDWKENERPK